MPFRERYKGLVIEHVSLAQATRKDAMKGCSRKAAAWRSLRRLVAQAVGNLAAWRKVRTHQHTPQRSVRTVAQELDGSGQGGHAFPHEPHASKRSMFRRPNLHEAAGNGRKKHARARQALGLPSPRSALTMASTAGWRGRSCWSSKWRHGCRCGWTGRRANARQLSDQEDWGELLPGPSLQEVDCKNTAWSGPRLHQPQGHSAAASPTAGALHRSAHGVRGKAGQTFVLGTHDGFEAQGIWRPSHHRPHGRSIACSFPLTQGAGAKVENEHDAAYFLGLPGQGVRSRSLGTLDHGGGSKRAGAVGGIVVVRFRQILRARRARSSVGGGSSRGDSWQVGAPPSKAGGSSRQTSETPASSATAVQAPMFHRCYKCLAVQTQRDMQVSQEARQAARSLAPAKQGTVCTRYFPLSIPQFCQQVHSSSHAQFCGTVGLQTGSWRAFSRTALLRAVARRDELAGPWCRSTQGLGTRRLPSTRLEQASGFPRRGQGNQGQGPHSATCRLGALPTCSKGETISLTPLQRMGADTHKPAFRVAKTVVACASLAKQAARWVAEAHVLLKFRGGDDTKAAAARPRVWPPRARFKRKRRETIAAPASSQVCDWLSPIIPSRFSQDSRDDPRTPRGHGLQLGGVFDSGGSSHLLRQM